MLRVFNQNWQANKKKTSKQEIILSTPSKKKLNLDKHNKTFCCRNVKQMMKIIIKNKKAL